MKSIDIASATLFVITKRKTTCTSVGLYGAKQRMRTRVGLYGPYRTLEIDKNHMYNFWRRKSWG